MARWRLIAPHYLQVPGTEWEYKEVDRKTGRPKTQKFAVPLLLDPSQPQDWTHQNGRDEGEINVCYEGKGDSNDIVFIGEPTPDMMPLDDEAKKISAGFAAKWKHPIESLPGAYSEHLLDDLQQQVADVQAKTSQTQVDGMSELLTAMAAMMKQNQELIGALVGAKAPAPAEAVARRA
jgi:hypothetical protein